VQINNRCETHAVPVYLYKLSSRSPAAKPKRSRSKFQGKSGHKLPIRGGFDLGGTRERERMGGGRRGYIPQ